MKLICYIQFLINLYSHFLWVNGSRTVREMASLDIKNFFYSNLFLGQSQRLGLYSNRSQNEGILFEATELNINLIKKQHKNNFILFYKLEDAHLFTDYVIKTNNILGKPIFNQIILKLFVYFELKFKEL